MPSLPEHEEYLKTRFFGSLDGLRCLSIVWVIGFHCKLDNTDLFLRGDWGVELFFIISGFLITTLLLREKRAHGTISLKNFYARRTLRIFPLYYATLLLYTALVIVLERGPERAAFFSNLPSFATYTSNWFVDRFAAERVVFAFCWSLATEEQFYLLWPSVQRLTKTVRTPILILSISLLGSLLVRLLSLFALLPFGATGERILMSVEPTILLGCLLAYAFDDRRWFDRLRGWLGGRWSAPVAIGLMAATYFGLPPAPAESLTEFATSSVFAFSLLLVVGTCCMREDNAMARLLANPAVRYIGTISYGLYLLHMVAMNGAKRILSTHDWAFFGVTLLLAVGLASVSYWLYERPILRLKSRFSTDVKNEPVNPALEASLLAPSPGALAEG